MGGAALLAAPHLLAPSRAAAQEIGTAVEGLQLALNGFTEFRTVLKAASTAEQLDALLTPVGTSDQLFHKVNELLYQTNAADTSTQEENGWSNQLSLPQWYSLDRSNAWSAIKYRYVVGQNADNIYAPFYHQDLHANDYYWIDPWQLLPTAPARGDATYQAASVSSRPLMASAVDQPSTWFTLPILNGQALVGLASAARNWADSGLYESTGVGVQDALLPLLSLQDAALGTPWNSDFGNWQWYLTANGLLGVNYFSHWLDAPLGTGGVNIVVKDFTGAQLMNDWALAKWA